MELHKMIGRRKSFRSYTDVPVDDGTVKQIKEFINGVRPLYPEIPLACEILPKSQVRCMLPWVTPQVIAIYTDHRPGALENVGFVFQQVDLYLQSMGLGTCWLGMGRLDGKTAAAEPRRDGLEFAMMLAFGYPKLGTWRKGTKEFKRRSLGEIADWEDVRLEPARLAPSSVNSQPWYFVHEGDVLHAYCSTKGLLNKTALSDMNRIDMGICLAHLYVSNPETFCFFKAEKPPIVKGRVYMGSVTL